MKKCAVFNDLSGFGKCSLAVAVPIISVMGIEAHPVPTAVLTNQTAYDKYSVKDLTDFMPNFISDWQNVEFDGILIGYIAHSEQSEYIEKFLEVYRENDTLVVVDPVMADDGELYDGFDSKKCQSVKHLASLADVVTPNLTELAILTDSQYTEDYESVCAMAQSLSNKNNQKVVVTGFRYNNEMHTLIFSNGKKTDVSCSLHRGSFSGTGDIFSSVLVSAMLKNKPVEEAAQIAVSFIEKSIVLTNSIDKNEGVAFEKCLWMLGRE